MNPEKDKDMVDELLAYKSTIDSIVQYSFNSDTIFINAEKVRGGAAQGPLIAIVLEGVLFACFFSDSASLTLRLSFLPIEPWPLTQHTVISTDGI